MPLQEGSDASGLYKKMFLNTAIFLHSNIIKCSKQSATIWLCILNIDNITIYFIYNQTINSKLHLLYPFALKHIQMESNMRLRGFDLCLHDMTVDFRYVSNLSQG